MKKRVAFVTILLAVATMAQAAVQYRLTFTKDATNWYLYTEAVSQTDNVGLKSFQMDVVGLPGTTITSSKLMAPTYYDEIQYLGKTYTGFVGFTDWPADGQNGIGISAVQKAGMESDVANPWPNLSTISHIGQLPGSGGTPPNNATWGVPCLLATGTYTGQGDFSFANAYGEAILEFPPLLSEGAPLTPVQFIPEPATLGLFAVAGARMMARRRRPSEVRAAE